MKRLKVRRILILVIMIGDTGVGKTHLLSRYVKGLLPRHNISTIGLAFATKMIHLSGNRKIQVNFWDTGR